MAITYGFYDSVGGDRVYNAEQMSGMFQGFFEPGVFRRIGDGLEVIPGTGMKVIVSTGRAWFNNTWTDVSAAEPLDIAAAPGTGLSRKDVICLEVNDSQAARANSLVVVTGVPAANPMVPSLTNVEGKGKHQYALAVVTVPSGATSITASMIYDNRGHTSPLYCPWVYVGVNVDSATALLKTGGEMSGPLTLNEKLILGVHTYGTELPSSGVEGQLFFKIPTEGDS